MVRMGIFLVSTTCEVIILDIGMDANKCIDQFLNSKVISPQTLTSHWKLLAHPGHHQSAKYKESQTNLVLQTNHRTDSYGGTPENRARFVLDILTETRKAVPPTFAIGIKLNSADHSSSTFEETMTQIALLVSCGLDFLEISGGTYEDPSMMGYPNTSPAVQGPAKSKSARTAAREAFFLEFAHTVRERHPQLVLMLTGGFRTRAGAEAAITDGACDLVGIGRPAAIDPKFPLVLLDEQVPDEKAVLLLEKAPVPWYARWLPRNLIGAGAESVSSSASSGK